VRSDLLQPVDQRVSAPQAGQIQVLPRDGVGSFSSACREIGVRMHQQLCGGMPAAMAH